MADMPKRIQRKRMKGWRVPPNSRYVGRPTKWGNHFPTAREYRYWLEVQMTTRETRQKIMNDIEELRGFDLLCWCAEDADCHADVLIEFANHT